MRLIDALNLFRRQMIQFGPDVIASNLHIRDIDEMKREIIQVLTESGRRGPLATDALMEIHNFLVALRRR